MIKRLFILLFGLFLLLAGVIGYLIVTFDEERYRPMLEAQLSSVLGQPVKIGQISLAWSGNLSLKANQVQVYPKSGSVDQPAVAVESLEGSLRIAPLLEKKIQLSRLVIKQPQLHLLREADGKIQIVGFEVPKPSVTPEPSSSPPSPETPAVSPKSRPSLPAVSVSFEKVQVVQGQVQVTDKQMEPELHLTVKQLDLEMSDVLSKKPSKVRGELSVFGSKQNVQVNGVVHWAQEGKPISIEGLEVEVNLEQVDMAQLVAAFPALEAVGLGSELSGVLQVEPKQEQTQVTLKNGALSLKALPSSLENCQFVGQIVGDQIDVETLTFDLGAGQVELSGSIQDWNQTPLSDVGLQIKRVRLESLLPPSKPGHPTLRGSLNVSSKAVLEGLEWKHWVQTATGDLELAIDDGVVENLNVLREVFRRIAIIPGLLEMLESRLPESYRAKLMARDTALEVVEFEAQAKQGSSTLKRFTVGTDTFQLSGEGWWESDGSFSIPATLRVERELSAVMVRSVNELEGLVDPSGRLKFPVRMEGKWPQVQVLPDIEYIASHILVSKAQEWIGDLIGKVLEG